MKTNQVQDRIRRAVDDIEKSGGRSKSSLTSWVFDIFDELLKRPPEGDLDLHDMTLLFDLGIITRKELEEEGK